MARTVQSDNAAGTPLFVLQLFLLAAAYYVAAKLSLRVALVGGVVTPIWPPTGIAFAALTVYGLRLAPAITLAAFAVNVPLTGSLTGAAIIAVGNTLAPLVAVHLLRLADFRQEMDRLRDALAVVVLGALVAMTVSASLGSAALLFDGTIDRRDLASTWATWWAGDATGILVFAPLLLSLVRPGWRGWAKPVEAVVLVSGLTTVAYLVFRTELESAYLVFPFLIWAGIRLGHIGASTATLTVVAMAVWAAVDEVGTFTDTTLLRRMLTLQVYNAVAALTSFVLAAVMLERRAALEEARLGFERERGIAETLQRSLLPDELPDIPGLQLASRYLPGAAGMDVGGDWYDAFLLPGGFVGLAIGDVVGRGLPAAAAMGQLRTALRAYALEARSPADAIERMSRLVDGIEGGQMATLVYAVLDPASGRLSLSVAGHPAPLLLEADGTARYLTEGRSPPLGVLSGAARDATLRLNPGSTLLFYTDGLVESRQRPIDDSLESLRRVVEGDGVDPETLCERVLEPPRPEAPGDDVALLVVQLLPVNVERLSINLAAEPKSAAIVRRALRGWLHGRDATPEEDHDLVLACGEAVANAIEHAYGPTGGSVEVGASEHAGEVTVTVSDTGRWRAPRDEGQGRGLELMRRMIDEVDIARDATGTTVTLRHRLGLERSTTSAPPGIPTPATAPARDVAIVGLDDAIDLLNATAVQAQLLRAVGNDEVGLVVDLSGVGQIDSSGLRMLYRVAERLAQHRQQVRLVVPAASPIRRVLTFAELHRRAPLAESRDEAIAAMLSPALDSPSPGATDGPIGLRL